MAKHLTLDFGYPEPDIDLGRVPIGGTVTFRVGIEKNGVPWDLTTTGSGVQLKFLHPDELTVLERQMTPVDPSAGVFEYTTTVDDIDAAGCWALRVRATDQRRDRVITCSYSGEVAFFAA